MTADAIPLLRASHLRPLLAAMRRIGAPTEKLMRQARLPLLVHDEPEAVVPELFVWDLAARVSRSEGIEDYGGFAATLMPAWESEPALIRVIQAAPTLWLALRTFCRLVERISTVSPFRIERVRDHALFSRPKPPGAAGVDQAELYILQIMIQLVRLAAGRYWTPDEVLVGQVNVRRLAASNAAGGGRVRPCESHVGILIPAGLLALPMSAIPAAPEGRLPGPLADDFLGSLRALIGSYLRDRKPDIGIAAQMAGLTERTFQRRLEAAGLTYRRLLDQIRLHQAVSLLGNPNAHITEIAYDLGFSDVAHFTRAFRRWTALSPREFRRRRLPPASLALGGKGQDRASAHPYPDEHPTTHTA